jgi:hypothetical protein
MLDTKQIELIRYALKKSKVLTVSTLHYSENERMVLDYILESFLKAFHMESLTTVLSYCLHELITNAQKANRKRLYFRQTGMNIHRSSDYIIGSRTMKNENPVLLHELTENLKKKRLQITVQFAKSRKNIRMKVKNGFALTDFEKTRIKDKISTALSLNSCSDSWADAADFFDGAGLGLLTIVQLLKKIGLTGRELIIYSRKSETQAVLTMNRKKLNRYPMRLQKECGYRLAIPFFKSLGKFK